MAKVHNFRTSLAKGKAAEAKFLERFKGKITQLGGKGPDFRIVKTNRLLEVKHDSYDPAKTVNYFLERYSYGEKDGGPHQALAKGAHYFAYCFSITGDIYLFDTHTLVERLNEIVKSINPPLISIFNSTHVTRGYKLARSLFSDILLNIDDVL